MTGSIISNSTVLPKLGINDITEALDVHTLSTTEIDNTCHSLFISTSNITHTIFDSVRVGHKHKYDTKCLIIIHAFNIQAILIDAGGAIETASATSVPKAAAVPAAPSPIVVAPGPSADLTADEADDGLAAEIEDRILITPQTSLRAFRVRTSWVALVESIP